GQGGTYHINEQWPFYWEAFFIECGYVKLDPVRRTVFSDPAVATHYKQNTFLYIDRARVDGDARLKEEWRLDQAQDVTVISLNRLVPLFSVTGLLGELSPAVLRSIKNRLG